MDRNQLNILAIGRDLAILQVVERLINGHEGWSATIAAPATEELHPEAVVARHFGGGSGLLENEVLAIINS